MRWKIYAIRDIAADVFLPPFAVRHRGEAVRVFRSSIAQAGTQMGDYPAEFALFDLGEWDDSSGSYTQDRPVEFITNGEIETRREDSGRSRRETPDTDGSRLFEGPASGDLEVDVRPELSAQDDD